MDDFDDVRILSPRAFQRQLRIEKRRADRTQSPLSLLLLSIKAEQADAVAIVGELLDLLQHNKRETDVLGCAAHDRVGLLLPHTNDQGVQAVIAGIAKHTAHLPITITHATYPDQLFDTFEGELGETPDALAYFLDDSRSIGMGTMAAKRTLDVVGSLVALIVFSPLMAVTAAAIALTSPGPVIFRQPRLGKGGTPFVFYKFRSMRIDSDDGIHREYVANLISGNLQQINQGDQNRPMYKMSADPRVTPVGRIIRKLSIDELPQLFNVLKGDMSLVGPRPPLRYEAEKYKSWHLRRVLEIRPGITGLWQVEGRSTTSFDDMVRLDLRYIRSCSLWLDLKILTKTVKVVLLRRGAA